MKHKSLTKYTFHQIDILQVLIERFLECFILTISLYFRLSQLPQTNDTYIVFE